MQFSGVLNLVGFENFQLSRFARVQVSRLANLAAFFVVLLQLFTLVSPLDTLLLYRPVLGRLLLLCRH